MPLKKVGRVAYRVGGPGSEVVKLTTSWMKHGQLTYYPGRAGFL